MEAVQNYPRSKKEILESVVRQIDEHNRKGPVWSVSDYNYVVNQAVEFVRVVFNNTIGEQLARSLPPTNLTNSNYSEGTSSRSLGIGKIRGFLLGHIIQLGMEESKQKVPSANQVSAPEKQNAPKVDIKQIQAFNQKVLSTTLMTDTEFGVFTAEVSTYLDGTLGESEKRKFLGLLEQNDRYYGKTIAKMKMYFKVLLSNLEGSVKERSDLRSKAPESQEGKEKPVRSEKNAKSSPKRQENNKVFVVHGHDETAKREVENVLFKLGVEPIILHDQSNEGQTIIEKFVKHAEQCTYAIVLLTPDDWAVPVSDPKPENAKFRARQNVIYEMGFFSGKLGRNRVCALHKGDLELPSDVSGVVWVSMDERGSWRFNIGKELKAANINVRLENL